MKGKLAALILFLAGSVWMTPVLAQSVENSDVAALINQRLGYMKDVAGDKARKHLAIEDLTQEASVLASAVQQARASGLDGESIRPFVQAQMDAAKAIQYRYRADWLSDPEQNWQPLPLDQTRLKITLLSASILTAIHAQLAAGKRFTDPAAFMQTLQQPHLTQRDKARLWQALQQIQLEK